MQARAVGASSPAILRRPDGSTLLLLLPASRRRSQARRPVEISEPRHLGPVVCNIPARAGRPTTLPAQCTGPARPGPAQPAAAGRRRRAAPATGDSAVFPPPFPYCCQSGTNLLLEMASTACFVIVSKNDIPIYEAEVGSAPKKEDLAYHHQFILHAALDVVQDLAWTTNAMFLRSVDRFNDLVVSVYVTAGHTRFMLLHDSRSEDGIKSFFQEVHELYIKIFLNPLYLPGSRIASSHFDTKVRALARKYL
ncbi:hypothetical protein ZWY2020_055755 [Hordeum vulgare]|nr:hypothetical protein ZWY2020_055755 [Hordeum vulgare]